MNALIRSILTLTLILTTYPAFGHLPECAETITARGVFSGGGEFNFKSQANSLSASGTFSYVNAADSLQLTSTQIVSYGFVDGGRYNDFAVRLDGQSAMVRLLIWDRGASGDELVLQVHAGGFVIFEAKEQFTADYIQLVVDCGGGTPPDGGGGTPPDGGGGTPPDGGGGTPPDGGGGTPPGGGGGTPPGGGGVEPPPGPYTCPLSKGYWKNHESHVTNLLAKGAINLGDRVAATLDDVLAVLVRANSSDARNMLRAQLLAALLNLRNNANPWNSGQDIRLVTEQAIAFLSTHSTPVSDGHPDRNQALALKDQLDEYNNSGGSGNCEGGGGLPPAGGGGEEPPDDEEPPVEKPTPSGTFTIGYWKNHPAHLASVLALGSINLGDTVVTNAAQAAAILVGANASDARNMLRAQLLAAALNVANGADGASIQKTIDDAREFLKTHTSPVLSGHPDRELALSLKDQLDAFNNSGEGTVEIVRTGGKESGKARVTVLWSGKGRLQQAPSVDGPWTDRADVADRSSFVPEDRIRFYRLRK